MVGFVVYINSSLGTGSIHREISRFGSARSIIERRSFLRLGEATRHPRIRRRRREGYVFVPRVDPRSSVANRRSSCNQYSSALVRLRPVTGHFRRLHHPATETEKARVSLLGLNTWARLCARDTRVYGYGNWLRTRTRVSRYPGNILPVNVLFVNFSGEGKLSSRYIQRLLLSIVRSRRVEALYFETIGEE